jgi:tripartite-type tricarboxylate transporter receptor subunit TctC
MGSRMLRKFLYLLALGTLAYVVAACGPAAPAAQPTTKPAAQPAAQQPAAQQPAAQPTAAPQAPAAAKPAAKFPTRPVTLIVPWGAGGGTDQVARIFASVLEKDFGQPVNVVNRTGGGGAVGHVAGSTAEPDGYTLTIVTTEIAMLAHTGTATVKPADFAPLAMVNIDPASVLVRADAKWNSLQELLDDAKANPGKLKASGTGRGGIWDLARAGMLQAAGLPGNAIEWVPSEGAAPALQELAAGGIDVTTNSLPEGATMIEAKKVKPLAYMGDKRDPKYPDVPTLKDLGINFATGSFRGFGLPKATSAEIVAIYESALKKAYDSNEYREFMNSKGFGMEWRDSKGWAQYMDAQFESMGKLMKDVGLAK